RASHFCRCRVVRLVARLSSVCRTLRIVLRQRLRIMQMCIASYQSEPDSDRHARFQSANDPSLIFVSTMTTSNAIFYIRLLVVALVLGLRIGNCQDKPPAPLSAKEIAAQVRASIVTISYAGREGTQQGLGTGFVIDKSGL